MSVSASDAVSPELPAELMKRAEGPSNLSKPERAEALPDSCFTVSTLNVGGRNTNPLEFVLEA